MNWNWIDKSDVELELTKWNWPHDWYRLMLQRGPVSQYFITRNIVLYGTIFLEKMLLLGGTYWLSRMWGVVWHPMLDNISIGLVVFINLSDAFILLDYFALETYFYVTDMGSILLFGVLLYYILFVQHLWMAPASNGALINIYYYYSGIGIDQFNYLWCHHEVEFHTTVSG